MGEGDRKLEYETPPLWARPSEGWEPHPVAEQMIDAGCSGRDLAKFFHDSRYAAEYLCKALERRLRRVERPACLCCGSKPVKMALMISYVGEVRRGSLRLGQVVNPASATTQYALSVCPACFERLARKREFWSRIERYVLAWPLLWLPALFLLSVGITAFAGLQKEGTIAWISLGSLVLFAVVMILSQGYKYLLNRQATKLTGVSVTDTKAESIDMIYWQPLQLWIDLVDTIDVPKVMAWMNDEHAGAVNVFLGTTRDETREDGVKLAALDYEADAKMAEAEIFSIVERALEKWPIVKVAVLHKVGRVALAEASVLVAVATPHRGESFEACRFIIDELKKTVPIWKKEVWADGKGSWKHPGMERELGGEAGT
jgi:molybdopterin synthase catalytic subunit